MNFRELHRPGDPLVLPNAWDYGSAAYLAAQGFAAIGTTSLGVAAAHGRPDGAGATKAETIELAEAVSGLGVLLTVDIEGGFSDDPAEVSDLVAALAVLGVAGVNLEDGRPDGTLRPIGLQQRIIEAALGHGVFVNARTDTCWLRTGDTRERVTRVRPRRRDLRTRADRPRRDRRRGGEHAAAAERAAPAGRARRSPSSPRPGWRG